MCIEIIVKGIYYLQGQGSAFKPTTELIDSLKEWLWKEYFREKNIKKKIKSLKLLNADEYILFQLICCTLIICLQCRTD